MEVNSQPCNHCMYTNLCNAAIQRKLSGCTCLFLTNNLCTWPSRVFGKGKCTGRVTVKIPVMGKTYTRGSQLHVTCRSIRNWDQNGIKQSTSFLRVDQGSRWPPNSKNQGIIDTKEAHAQLPFCLVNQVIKSSRRGQSNDQLQILPIKIFIPQTVQKTT